MHDVLERGSVPAANVGDAGVLRRAWRNAFPFIVVGALWETVAHLGIFPAQFFPPLETIAAAFARLTGSGVLPHHALDTLVRLTVGFALAAVVGIAAGVLMGRSRRAEDILLPLVSIGAPIPGLAYAPLFLLWFGPGNIPAIALVAFVSAFPVIYNSWTGVRAVNPIWLRAAGAMGAKENALFWKVIIPGASPFIIAGLRQSFLRAWIAVIGAEMLAGSDFGLGWVIFDAKEFLDADVMLASLIVIGFIGFVTERLVFGSLERATIYRWGMARSGRV
jgi:NitT/TauT family transport system permease protein